jgi:hypothetical protein
MTAYSEEVIPVNFSQGMFTADLASAIPDGYCAEAKNCIPTGTSVESRFGFKPSSVEFDETYDVEDRFNSFSHLGFTGDPDAPMVLWGSGQGSGSPKLHMIREGDPLTDPGGSAGYLDASIPADFYSAVNYNGEYYLFLSSAVYKLTNINWSAGTFTTTVVPNSPVGSVQAIHFFDRLWTAHENKLYWTDPPASPGGLLETWDTTNNFLALVGNNGPAKIFKIIPLGSRIFAFTSQGLFSITVTGTPTDWYSRPLDDNAIVNSYECAFEVGGLIYYISIYGVFVTNGADSIKLSGPIENNFLAGNFERGDTAPSKRANIYRLNYMDGGMIASVSHYYIDSGTAYYDVDFCRNFYTRLGTTAWSEWNFNTTLNNCKLAGVQVIADSVESYINKSPLSYLMCIVTDSRSAGTNRSSVRQLMVYDGLKDEWVNPTGSPSITESNVQVDIKTQFFNSGSPTNFKTYKYGFLEMYISNNDRFDDSNYWTYAWQTERAAYDESTSVAKIDPSELYDIEFTAVKLNAGFKFRMCQFQLSLNTNNTDTFKVKNLYLVQHTERDGPYSIQ